VTRLLTVKETAQVLRLSPSKVYQLAQSRRLGCVRQDGRLLFAESQVEAWINRCTVQEEGA
jgi:excisionase family DNA binding protein